MCRTTRDYEGPSVAPRVQAALDAAMNNIEEDLDIDALAITNAFAVKGTRKEKKKARPKSGRDRRENYPQSRGLVPKWSDLTHQGAGGLPEFRNWEFESDFSDSDSVSLNTVIDSSENRRFKSKTCNQSINSNLAFFCVVCLVCRLLQIIFQSFLKIFHWKMKNSQKKISIPCIAQCSVQCTCILYNKKTYWYFFHTASLLFEKFTNISLNYLYCSNFK